MPDDDVTSRTMMSVSAIGGSRCAQPKQQSSSRHLFSDGRLERQSVVALATSETAVVRLCIAAAEALLPADTISAASEQGGGQAILTQVKSKKKSANTRSRRSLMIGRLSILLVILIRELLARPLRVVKSHSEEEGLSTVIKRAQSIRSCAPGLK